MKNKIYFILLSSFVHFTSVCAQDVVINTEKLLYKIDEEITVKFECNKEVDSLQNIEFENFIILNHGPSKSKNSSSINGVKENSTTLIYKLKAKHEGDLKLISPIFYSGKNQYKASEITLTIYQEKLTLEEQKNIKLKNFVSATFKPKGTIRFVILEEMGYIEENQNNKWIFIRELTEREMKRLKQK
ncbi:MAG: BatD family protein [Bacteroidota bacterium]